MTQKITAQELLNKMRDHAQQKIICVDVRTEVEHDLECIEGSMNIPIDQLRSHIGDLKRFDVVYVYCASGNRSAMACDILNKSGVSSLYDLQDGLNGWKMNKFPTIGTGKNRLPLMQQVLIVVGVVVGGSVICGYMVSELFFIIPLLMSIGLLYAGFSGNCLMTKILIAMPWNQHK